MGENTKIEWAHHTFNPWTGCTKVSPACDHCYAEAWAKRSGLVRWGNNPRRRTSAANWRKPLKWNQEAAERGIRYRVFCASLADVFDNHGSITSGWRGDLWHLISRTSNLDWLLLTKRPQNIAKMLPDGYGAPAWGNGWPNVWLGVTAENQEEANRRIPILLSTPAAVRWISAEPLLGPVDLTLIDDGERGGIHLHFNALNGLAHDGHQSISGIFGQPDHKLDWVVSGGESGPGARPMHPDWARSLRDQCAAAGVPFLFKQWGEYIEVDGQRAQQIRPNLKDETCFFLTPDQQRVPRDEGYRRGWTAWNHSIMRRVGKTAAGRLLDGVLHDGFPTTNATGA